MISAIHKLDFPYILTVMCKIGFPNRIVEVVIPKKGVTTEKLRSDQMVIWSTCHSTRFSPIGEFGCFACEGPST